MNLKNELYKIHEDASNLFDNLTDLEARDAISQTLCVTRTMIFVLESGGELQDQEVLEAISHAKDKIATALAIIEPIPPTIRSTQI